MKKYADIPTFNFSSDLLNLIFSDNEKFENNFISIHETKDEKVKKQQDDAKKMGYSGGHNKFAQIHCSETDLLEPIKAHSALLYPKSSILIKKPGNVIGWHQDTFFMFRKSCPKYDEEVYVPIRYMYFPIKSYYGHAFCVEGEWITQWDAGYGITWHPNAGHCGVNAGGELAATINVTGLIEIEEFNKLNLFPFESSL